MLPGHHTWVLGYVCDMFLANQLQLQLSRCWFRAQSSSYGHVPLALLSSCVWLLLQGVAG